MRLYGAHPLVPKQQAILDLAAGTTIERSLQCLPHTALLARMFRPLFKLVSNSLWMLPLGFLFGLGFDTATEVSLLGISLVGRTTPPAADASRRSSRKP